MLAHALFEENAQANIDEAIRHQETTWEILRPVPPGRGYQQAPANLGGFYIAKGDMVGGAATAEGRAWYEKAVGVLQEGRQLSRVIEKHYDDAQLAHGKPLSARAAMPNLYLNLGAAYAELGRNAEAVEAFQYGRNLQPEATAVYNGLTGAYLSEGKTEWAAISLAEKAQMDGSQPATLSALRALYGRLPDGACAVSEEGGALKLNMECPRLRTDLCTAWVDLAHAFGEARQPARSREFKDRAAGFGCAASVVEAEGVVSLFEKARAGEPALGFRKSRANGVLDDGERGRSLRQQVEGGGILTFERVGRIEENDVGPLAGEVAAEGEERRASDDGGARFEFEGRQIFANGLQGGAVFLQEPGMAGAAAEGFDSDRAGSGIGVEKSGTLEVRGQDVEKGFAQAVGRGACGISRYALEAARTELSGDDAHQPTVTRA
jgi:hypothetical protein